MSTATATVDLRSMSDDALLEVYLADPDDERTRAAMLAECARRDRLEQARREREQVRAEWHDAAYADYLAAEAECKGELVNRAGVAAGVRDGFALWSGPRHFAYAYCTEELAEWWQTHPRLTTTEYARQRAAGARDARQAALFADAAEAAGAEDITIITETEEIIDEHDAEDHADHDAAVDGHDAPAIRPVGEGPAAHAVRGAGCGRDGGPLRPARRAMISFADVAPQETMLLSSRPYLPYGEVSLVYGEGSLGKGRMVQSIIAAVTNGQPVGLDESTDDDAGDVIVILPEDKQGESAVKRLIAAGANLRRCWDMTRTASGERFKLSATPRDPGHLPELRAAIEQLRADGRNPRLLVIDPLGACIGEGTILTSKGARHLIESLQDLAEQTGICLLVVAHPVSGGKLQGSWALHQALRSVFYVRHDESNPDVRLLANVKGNDVPPELAADIPFTIVDGPRGPRAEWVRPERTATGQVRAGQPDWRDELTSRRAERAARTTPAAPVSQADARAAGCKHSRTKFGTAAQCSDCPAARLSAPAAPGPAAQPAMTYRAVMTVKGRGSTVLASGITDPAFARMLCEATPEAQALAAAGQRLQWVQSPDGRMKAARNSADTIAWAIAAEGSARAAV